MPKDQSKKDSKKHRDLETAREESRDQHLTTNQGLRINDDQNSLKARARGPSVSSTTSARRPCSIVVSPLPNRNTWFTHYSLSSGRSTD